MFTSEQKPKIELLQEWGQLSTSNPSLQKLADFYKKLTSQDTSLDAENIPIEDFKALCKEAARKEWDLISVLVQSESLYLMEFVKFTRQLRLLDISAQDIIVTEEDLEKRKKFFAQIAIRYLIKKFCPDDSILTPTTSPLQDIVRTVNEFKACDLNPADYGLGIIEFAELLEAWRVKFIEYMVQHIDTPNLSITEEEIIALEFIFDNSFLLNDDFKTMIQPFTRVGCTNLTEIIKYLREKLTRQQQPS